MKLKSLVLRLICSDLPSYKEFYDSTKKLSMIDYENDISVGNSKQYEYIQAINSLTSFT